MQCNMISMKADVGLMGKYSEKWQADYCVVKGCLFSFQAVMQCETRQRTQPKGLLHHSNCLDPYHTSFWGRIARKHPVTIPGKYVLICIPMTLHTRFDSSWNICFALHDKTFSGPQITLGLICSLECVSPLHLDDQI